MKRIVITGLGVVSSIGIGKDAFWDALIAGKSGISEIASFDTANFNRHYGGEAKNFRPEDFIEKERLPNFGRAASLAIAAGKLGLKEAALDRAALENAGAGIILGTTMGETQVVEKINQAWIKDGFDAIDAKLIPMYPPNILAASTAMELGLKGSNYVIPTACAAGNYAIGFAFDLIKDGKAQVMLAGGADAFSKIAFVGFNRLLAVAPEKCQPFDKNRKGMIVAEGSGIVVLEDLDHALKRNATIYAEVLGYGLSCDAFNMTAPESSGVAKAIEKSIKESSISKKEVNYISAHGTGTPTNDKVESKAFNLVFGEDTKNIAISSIKSMLGHTMGAASAIEAIACCLAVKNNIVPPTINYETPDLECDIDCVPNIARKMEVNIALNTASAFGGNNACVVFKKFQD